MLLSRSAQLLEQNLTTSRARTMLLERTLTYPLSCKPNQTKYSAVGLLIYARNLFHHTTHISTPSHLRNKRCSLCFLMLCSSKRNILSSMLLVSTSYRTTLQAHDEKKGIMWNTLFFIKAFSDKVTVKHASRGSRSQSLRNLTLSQEKRLNRSSLHRHRRINPSISWRTWLSEQSELTPQIWGCLSALGIR